jgi:hypothetical protein
VSRSRSILLQVAFKEAVGATLGTDVSVADRTKEFYQTLISLHEELGITIEDDKPRGGGGSYRPSKPKAELPGSVIEFTDANGTLWVDWRPAKATGDAKSTHPDFKTLDQSKGVGQSVWLFAQDGSENEQAVELAKAADQMAGLVSPM